MHFIRRIVLATGLVLGLTACSPQAAIGVIFGDRAGEATDVARCESGLNHMAVSPGGGNHGLFQINNVHRSTWERVTGKPWADRYDPVLNTAFAKWLFDQQGWRPWTCRYAID